MLVANTDGHTTPTIACTIPCNEQTVRNAIHIGNARGLAALTSGSSRPIPTRLSSISHTIGTPTKV